MRRDLKYHCSCDLWNQIIGEKIPKGLNVHGQLLEAQEYEICSEFARQETKILQFSCMKTPWITNFLIFMRHFIHHNIMGLKVGLGFISKHFEPEHLFTFQNVLNICLHFKMFYHILCVILSCNYYYYIM